MGEKQNPKICRDSSKYEEIPLFRRVSTCFNHPVVQDDVGYSGIVWDNNDGRHPISFGTIFLVVQGLTTVQYYGNELEHHGRNMG